MHPDLTGLLDGIHFHTLCEQDSSDLETTLAAVKVKFGDLISQVKWLNLGGGHHITRPGYDIARLEKCIEADGKAFPEHLAYDMQHFHPKLQAWYHHFQHIQHGCQKESGI